MGEKKRRLQQIAGGALAVADYDQLLAAGRDLRTQGRLGEAEVQFERAYRAAPKRPEAVVLLGLAYFERGAHEVGLGLLRQAVELAPAEATAERVSYAYALSAASRFDEAARELRLVAQRKPDDVQICRDLGALLVNLGRFEEAEQWYRQAADHAPARADLHEALAGLQYRSDQLDAAARSFELAFALDPSVARRIRIGVARAAAAPKSASGEPWALVRRSEALDDAAARAACDARGLVIVDDALPDPDAYRAQALALDYRQSADARGVNFPGRQTDGQPCQALMERIAGALGHDVKWLSPDNGAFRSSGADSVARSDIHVDPDDGSAGPVLAGLLYLTLPEQCRGGTSFWRHRSTGWEQRPTIAELRARGYPSFAEFERQGIHIDRARAFAEIALGRAELWDFLFEIPLRYNRLAIYRADYFHAVSNVFGSSPEDARLVQLFYFKRAAAPS